MRKGVQKYQCPLQNGKGIFFDLSGRGLLPLGRNVVPLSMAFDHKSVRHSKDDQWSFHNMMDYSLISHVAPVLLSLMTIPFSKSSSRIRSASAQFFSAFAAARAAICSLIQSSDRPFSSSAFFC